LPLIRQKLTVQNERKTNLNKPFHLFNTTGILESYNSHFKLNKFAQKESTNASKSIGEKTGSILGPIQNTKFEESDPKKQIF